MSNLIAAVIVAVCLPSSDYCDIEVPDVWKQPTAADLHKCASAALARVEAGEDAHCEVAYSHSIDDPAYTPIHDLASREEVEQFLAPLKD